MREYLLNVVDNDFSILRNFRGQCSLATYLTVIARRIVLHALINRKVEIRATANAERKIAAAAVDPHPNVEERLSSHEEIVQMLSGLDIAEAEVVRLYHLEGKSYQEISFHTGIPENSIGPILSRARTKLRRTGMNSATKMR